MKSLEVGRCSDKKCPIFVAATMDRCENIVAAISGRRLRAIRLTEADARWLAKTLAMEVSKKSSQKSAN